MITRHDQDMLRALQLIGKELKRANDLKEKEQEKETMTVTAKLKLTPKEDN